MIDKHAEVMNILQEECAEVIQAVSKCRRFGIDGVHLTSGKSNRDNLTEEVGDLLCMIDLLIKFGLVDDNAVYLARAAKEEKLKKWSEIYN
jgi:NTP pyrophosphatase (non-canonical NTP hydrolase)|tara:strand:+ start:32532 stop:32804 length:273 start_codon:yes stop_codon:yes gene_type:complete